MKIALDYDETAATDEALWGAISRLLRINGNEVKIVTSRSKFYENWDIEAFAKKWELKIIYCAHSPKRECYQADIWIDDMPESIPIPQEQR